MDIPLILDTNYPTAKWGGSASTYSNLKWKDLTIPKPTILELEAQWLVLDLALAKEEKIIELSKAAGVEITKGFPSAALGVTYFYDGTQEDQLNLVGAVTSGLPMPFSVRVKVGDTAKVYKLHTPAQLHQVLEDGKAYKLGILIRFNTFKDSVLAATNLLDLGKIKWA